MPTQEMLPQRMSAAAALVMPAMVGQRAVSGGKDSVMSRIDRYLPLVSSMKDHPQTSATTSAWATGAGAAAGTAAALMPMATLVMRRAVWKNCIIAVDGVADWLDLVRGGLEGWLLSLSVVDDGGVRIQRGSG